MSILQAALSYRTHGLSVVPTNRQTKRPMLSRWKQFQSEIASDEAIQGWFGSGVANVSIVGGAVSGGLLCIDFDEARFYDTWLESVGDLADGLIVQKTGKGYHIIFRCAEPGGNAKLAFVPDDNEESGRRAAIETKGEGGYFQVDPSIHDTGRQYRIIAGSLADIPFVQQERVEALLDAARSLDEAPETRQQIEARARRAQPTMARERAGGGSSVIDSYNAAVDVEELLERNGYKPRSNGYVRPGGDHVSVYVLESRNGEPPRTYHHNSNDPLCDGYAHNAFDLFCHFYHGGDVKTAVKAAAQFLGMQFAFSVNGQAVTASAINGNCEESPTESNGLPEIKINNRPLQDISNETMAALVSVNNPPALFVRSGSIVRIAIDENSRPRIDNVDDNALRGHMARAAKFYRVLKDGTIVWCSPPLDVVRDVASLTEWNFPPLEGIIEVPSIRTDGTIIQSPGYDAQTKLFYHNSGAEIEPIPENPTDRQINDAISLIIELLNGFPFVDEASLANAIGLLITPVVRAAIDGCVPLGIVDAPQAGTGKTILASTASVIATGRDAALMTAPKTKEEWKKQITSVLLSGATVIIIDNVNDLYSDDLASALTATTISDRLLGKHEHVVIPQRATWVANGNNVRLGGDLPRRCYWIRIDAKMSRPWQREGFSHVLPDWAEENREKFIAAILTIARAWWAAGRPASRAPRVGSFTDWCETVGGILENAGINGFLSNLNVMYERVDDEAPQWEAFIFALYERFGTEQFTTSQVCLRFEREAEFSDLVPDSVGQPFGKDGKASASFKRRFGRAMAKREGTRYGDKQVFLKKITSTGSRASAKWAICGIGNLDGI